MTFSRRAAYSERASSSTRILWGHGVAVGRGGGGPGRASHAGKGHRRSRYNVSRSLMKGPAARVDGGWRLPAGEIERSIAAAAQSVLDDQQTGVSVIEEAPLG